MSIDNSESYPTTMILSKLTEIKMVSESNEVDPEVCIDKVQVELGKFQDGSLEVSEKVKCMKITW